MPHIARTTEPMRPKHRVPLLSIVMLAALAAALTAAIVTSAAGTSLPGILAASGVTFAATVSIGFATCQFLGL